MSGSRTTRWAKPILLASIIAAVGCSDSQSQRAESDYRHDHTRSDKSASQTYGYAGEERERNRDNRDLGDRIGDRLGLNNDERTTVRSTGDRQVLNFPGETGSVLRLEKIGSSEVRAGENYQYTIRVTNTSDNLILDDVQVFSHLAQGPARQPVREARRPAPAPEPAPVAADWGDPDRQIHRDRMIEDTNLGLYPNDNRSVAAAEADPTIDRQVHRDRVLEDAEGAPGTTASASVNANRSGASATVRRDGTTHRVDSGGYARTDVNTRTDADRRMADARTSTRTTARTSTDRTTVRTENRTEVRRGENDVYAIAREDEATAGANATGADAQGNREFFGQQNWNVGVLMPGESRTIQADSDLPDEGSFMQCFSVHYRPMLCTTVNVVKPGLALTKTAPPTADICEPVRVHYVLTNTGSATARNVRVEEDLPEGVTTQDGQRKIVLTAGDLAPGRSVEKTVMLKATNGGEIAGSARATDASGFSVQSENTRTVIQEPQIALAVTGPEREYIGKDVTYNVTVTNKSDFAVRNVMVKADGLRGLQTTTEREGDRAAASSAGSWNIGTLNAGESKTINVNSRGAQQGTIEGRFTATAYCADAQTQTVRTQFVGIPALLIEVVDQNDPVRIGTNEIYTITVTNQGSAVDKNVRLRIDLPAQQDLVSVEGVTKPEGANLGRSFELPAVRELAPGAKATWRVTTKANAAGDTRFKVTLNSDQLTSGVVEEESTNLYDAAGEPVGAAGGADNNNAAPDTTTGTGDATK